MRLWITYMLAVMTLPALHCSAQVVPQHVIDSIANPPIAEDKALVFARTNIDSIKMSEDDAPVDFFFDFSNAGNKPLVITRVETSCGCATANYNKQPVQPGGKGRVTVTYNPDGHSGKLLRKIFVFTNSSGTYPAARLTLEGEIMPSADAALKGYPVAMGNLRLKSRNISIGEISRSTSKTERIECVNSGNKPLRLQAMAMTPDWITFRTEPEVIGPGETADLVMTVDGTRIPAGMKGDLTHSLIIEGPDVRPSERSLRITVHIK